MQIREARIEDKKELIELLMQAQELHCKNRPDIFKQITKKEVESEVAEVLESQERKMIVAVNDKEKVCGLVIFRIKEVENHINLKNAKILYVGKIVVDKKCQRQGIGTLLMQEMNKIAKELKCNRMELSCWSFNKEAIEFYKAQGMKVQRLNMEIGVIKDDL